MPPASELELIISVGAIVNAIVLVAVATGVAESVTVIATENGPVAVGVPEIAPVPAAMDKPTGRPVAVQL